MTFFPCAALAMVTGGSELELKIELFLPSCKVTI